MPVDITKNEVNIGEVVYEWELQEYEQPERSARWYWVMGSVAAALLVYAVVSADYLFGLFVALLAIIMFLRTTQAPAAVPFAMTTTGIVLGKKYFRFSELSKFWIIYNPPQTKNLYFSTQSWMKHRLTVPLYDFDPVPVREFLGQYLVEDLEQEEEPFVDQMGRLLGLH
jgi:hypothetical protein